MSTPCMIKCLYSVLVDQNMRLTLTISEPRGIYCRKWRSAQRTVSWFRAVTLDTTGIRIPPPLRKHHSMATCGQNDFPYVHSNIHFFTFCYVYVYVYSTYFRRWKMTYIHKTTMYNLGRGQQWHTLIVSISYMCVIMWWQLFMSQT